MKSKTVFFKSIRTKLFFSLCLIVIAIIVSLILLNNFVLRQFYEYNKQKQLETVYYTINDYYNTSLKKENLKEEFDKIAIENNFDILIKDDQNASIYSSNKDFFSSINDMLIAFLIEGKGEILKTEENYKITKYNKWRNRS